MRALVIDTETTSVIPRGMDPTHADMPRIVQFAAILRDSDKRERAAVSLVVVPDVRIPEAASNIHGITHTIADEFGVAERGVVGIFLRLLQKADIVICHHAAFDLAVMRGACHRAGATWIEKPTRCTMVASTNVVMLPPTPAMVRAGFDKFKPPKLEEAYEHLTGKKMAGAHDALVDVLACIEVYDALCRLGVWPAGEQAA